MTTIAAAEQRVILENVSWETYERLLAESIESLPRRQKEIFTAPVRPPSSERIWPKDSSRTPAFTSATRSRLAAKRNWIW